MSCRCGRPVNGQGNRCCQACRYAPSSSGHTRYCRRRNGDAPGRRQPTDLSTFDEVEVARAVAGRRTGMISPADAREATRRLVLQGYSDGQVAYAVGRTRRQVIRMREALNLPPALPRGTGLSVWRPELPSRPLALH